MTGKVNLIGILCVCLAISCGEREQQLNLVFIGVDTLRRDHVGCYGYERSVSPNIDRLAAEGVLFEDAVSQSPWTLPSFATALTSLYPTQHGAGSLNLGAGPFGTRMGSDFPPLAMILLKRGYSTGAIINAPALAPELGVDRGFEYYHTTPRWRERIADGTTEDALEWIDLNKDAPFFMFVHYFDPHLPYAPPAPYDTIFDPEYRGRIGNSFDMTYFPRAKATQFETMQVLSVTDWNHIRSLYDGEIAFADQAIGALLRGLEERDLRKNTLIVLLSDHGEEFYEHLGFEHGHTLFDELIKVPLVFSLPGRLPENLRVSRQVRLLDVMPTVLELMGIPPASVVHLEGASLMPLITGKDEIESSGASLLPHRFAYSEAMLYGTEKKSITAHPWKLIYDTATKDRMLFNLAQDPGENDDLREHDLEAAALLDEVLLQTMFGISDTWFIELGADGQKHTFDLKVTPQKRPSSGSIVLHKALDAGGRFVEDHLVGLTPTPDDGIMLNGLELDGMLTLAFKVRPHLVPVTFDLKIDGRPALERTFLGESLVAPDQMPFTDRGARKGATSGEASRTPVAPYFIVWHSTAEFYGSTSVTLSEDTKAKLRALGYIQ